MIKIKNKKIFKIKLKKLFMTKNKIKYQRIYYNFKQTTKKYKIRMININILYNLRTYQNQN